MRFRHTGPGDPGYTRKRQGRGFRYLDTSGRPVRDPDELARVKALAIPPAWEKVWICPWRNGHLQAMGTDAAGRRQYLYHPRFRAEQEEAKHNHVLDVAEALPDLRETVNGHLADRGLTHDRVMATAARLLDLGFFRVGNDRYTDRNQSYGLTTLLRSHTHCGRSQITFDFPGKHGRQQVRAVADSATCRAVRALKGRHGGGEKLMAYWQRPDWHDVSGEDINAYLRAAGGVDITAKDFRTWHATTLAAVGLGVSAPADRTGTARRRAVTRTVREVAEYLGNTPAVCRASYIDPRVLELYEDGVTIAPVLHRLGDEGGFGTPATQGTVEQAVVHILRTGRPPDAGPDRI